MIRNQKKPLLATSSAKLMLVSVDRLLQQKIIVEGTVLPANLPELSEYLLSEKGEICYQFQGNTLIDQSGTKKQRVKCIISGWFEIADAITMQAIPFTLDIVSNLVLVSTEEALPPLEAESEEEDYIVCGAVFDVLARIQEEILLALPTNTPRQTSRQRGSTKLSKALKPSTKVDSVDEKRATPFAKLAVLKKSG